MTSRRATRPVSSARTTIASTLVVATLFCTVPIRAMAERGHCDGRVGDRARVAGGTDEPCLLIGGALIEGESEYLSDPRTLAFPIVRLTWARFYWDLTEVGYYVLGDEGASGFWGVAAVLALPADGFRVGDETHLAGLKDRDPTLEGGIELVGGGRWGTLEIGANIDLEGEFDGYTAYAGYEFPLRFGKLTASPGVSMKYRDARNGNHYYGVDDVGDAGRAAYLVDEPSVSVGIGYSASYALDDRWSLFHSLEVWLLDDVLDDSPLTVNEEPGALSVGVLYRLVRPRRR